MTLHKLIVLFFNSTHSQHVFSCLICTIIETFYEYIYKFAHDATSTSAIYFNLYSNSANGPPERSLKKEMVRSSCSLWETPSSPYQVGGPSRLT